MGGGIIMGRSTVYNSGLATEEKWSLVNEDNKELLKDFINYCKASDLSPQTCYQYEQQIRIVFVWISENAHNKHFTEIKKKEWVLFVGYLSNTLGVSSNRIASIKSAISSLSNYIENILDEDYPSFRNIIKNIPTPKKSVVREKTVLSEEEIQKGLDQLVAAKKYQIACFLALLFGSGMRKAEALQILCSDLTPEREVQNGIFYSTHTIRTKGHGKQGKPLSKYVFKDIVKPYYDLWMKERETLGIKIPQLFVVYHNGQYEPAKISTANSWSEKITKIVGQECYCHNFRHAWATFCHKKGYSASLVQKLQGWAGLEMVNLYTDISAEEEIAEFFTKMQQEDSKGE